MLNRFEELKLVAKCTLTDDRDAFGKLVEAYQSDIRRFFLNLTGDACLSDDLAQETFIKAYISIGSFMGLARFKTWIYRIAYNEFYDWTRKRKEERLDDEESTADNEMEYYGNENDCSTRIDIANESGRKIGNRAVLYGRQTVERNSQNNGNARRYRKVTSFKGKNETRRIAEITNI